MLARLRKVISFGSRPRKPGIQTTSFSLLSDAKALPNFTLSISAWRCIMRQPSLMSWVMTFPPNGITAVWRIRLSWKIATSVVPPPISTRTTPASFSSSESTASAEAIGSKMMSLTLRPDRSTQRVMFCTLVT